MITGWSWCFKLSDRTWFKGISCQHFYMYLILVFQVLMKSWSFNMESIRESILTHLCLAIHISARKRLVQLYYTTALKRQMFHICGNWPVHKSQQRYFLDWEMTRFQFSIYNHPWLADVTAAIGSQEVVDHTHKWWQLIGQHMPVCRLGPQVSAGWVPSWRYYVICLLHASVNNGG